MNYLHNHAFQAIAMNMINTYKAEAKQYSQIPFAALITSHNYMMSMIFWVSKQTSYDLISVTINFVEYSIADC